MSLPDAAPGTQVIVTGASSGIGMTIARLLAQRGHQIGLVARRRERMEELATELRASYGVEVDVHPYDLGDSGARRELVETLLGGGVTVVGLCNCAGFGTAGRFLELDNQRELEQIAVNIDATLELTHAFAGPMVRHGSGAILNVASVAAFQPLPGLATYAATKAFVQSFSEAVHEELHGTGVSVTVLCPGPVETEWAQVADAGAAMIGPAKVPVEDVARAAVEGMVNGKRSVIPGVVVQAMANAGRFMPRTVLLPAVRRILDR